MINRYSAIFAVLILVGCATAEMTPTYDYRGPKLPKPSRILVYDFSADSREIPAFSPLRSRVGEWNPPQSQEQFELGRKLGVQVASDIAGKIRGMGLSGFRMPRQSAPAPGDLVLMGYFMTLDEGSTAKRMIVGFGSGSAELKVIIEGYRMTEQGLIFLGSGEGMAASGASPGTALSLGVAIATANPAGLIISGAMKTAGELSGRQTIEGASQRIADLISERLAIKFKEQGWIYG